MKILQPRICTWMGESWPNSVFPDGTWLESEAFCYPEGGWTRRAYVTCEDGKKRAVTCTIPDTFFSIPARTKIKGRSVKGFVSTDEIGVKFTEITPKQFEAEVKDG